MKNEYYVTKYRRQRTISAILLGAFLAALFAFIVENRVSAKEKRQCSTDTDCEMQCKYDSFYTGNCEY